MLRFVNKVINIAKCRQPFKTPSLKCLFSTTNAFEVTWNLEEISLTCNEGYWEEYPEGFELNLKYIDTHPDNSKHKGTILGLHGTPGTHKDLLSVLQPLADDGYRVVIPVMPGLGITKSIFSGDEILFTHSTEEKAALIGSLLNDLGILKLDFAIGHCTGGCLLTLLLSRTGFCKSAIYLCPFPVWKPPRAYQPVKYVERLVRLHDKNVIFRPTARYLMNRFCKDRGIRVPDKYVFHVMKTALEIGYALLPGLTTVIKRNPELPISLIYASNDIMIEESLSLEYAEMLGINSQAVYNESDEKLSRNEDFKRAIRLNTDSHLPLDSDEHRKIITNEIYHVLAKS